MLDLHQRAITYLPGVGPKRAEVLQKEVNLASYEDLLYYIPYKYMDRSRFYRVSDINGSMPYIQLKGRILSFEMLGEGSAKRLIGKFSDGTGTIDLVWFKQIHWVTNKLKPDVDYIVFGKPTLFGNSFNMVHPDVDPIEQAAQVAQGLTPYYNTTERMKKIGLNSRALQNLIFNLLSNLQWQVPEILSPDLLQRTKLISLSDALRQIHFPESIEMMRKAQQRLKFDELFFIQLNLLQRADRRKRKQQGLLFARVGDYFNTFYKTYLPFELTNAQKRVIREIRADMGSGRQMNRLLQGDVGSGKTLVALLCMLLALDNQCQACIMAPTEILAAQHYATIQAFLRDMPVKVALLTGSTKKKERNQILPAIAQGEIQIVIGTHALIEEQVVFASLGLAVIDEQHRFGVEQRSRLWSKNVIPPHVLVMTATPIPRTLAMTLYGDLDVSVIDELPPGRKPVRTIHRYDTKKAELYAFLRSEIQKGRQVYVVYPLIEGNEKFDYKDLEAGYETFQQVFPEYQVCMVHGRMKPAEKEACMQQFVSGKAQILLATTVIEVGVNVPNASVMVIESAERFGLSQLHQLRGRVGRGAEQSYCILVSSHKLSNDTRKRLEIMVSSNNGFEIAEADLRLRGHGDLEGTRQSGQHVDLKIANLVTDGSLLQYARELAEEILNKDPDLQFENHSILSKRLKVLFAKQVDWGKIS
ncbi:MAG: ATP-dependent DNA helicase RecG [Parabacteroides sp.]|nr:ATP-dependent DNA helicase RecG [Parabacteroides sp.]MDY5638954.1 ATP-dependent DNA helicase RecG [Parabacteroides sp.]